MKAFNLRQREAAPRCHEIQIEGELDLAVAERLWQTLGEALREHDEVLVDLAGCEFIDSTGIAMLVRAHNESEARGRRFVVHSASRQVLRVLEVTGLTENGLVFESQERALAGR
ncbi:MAG TPA: STAS domain-containing protein [Solirubrobacterales bacterium]|nr:STAS domain-containing protein [Solirubrobacterales bacterium]